MNSAPRTTLGTLVLAALAALALGAQRADAGERQDPKAPAKGSAAPALLTADDVARAEDAAKLLPNPAPAAGLESLPGWASSEWEDPCQLSKIDLPKSVVKSLLRVTTGEGKKGKSLPALTKDLALPEKGTVRLAVFNAEPEAVNVAVVFWITAGFVYYESPSQKVEPGAWKVLEFDVAADNYKTEKTKWQHTASLAKRDSVKRVGVLISSSKPATLYICGLNAEAAGATKPVAVVPAPDPAAALKERVEKLKALVAKMQADPQYPSPDFFWPAERQARLEYLQTQRDYDGANALLDEALKDYRRGPVKNTK